MSQRWLLLVPVALAVALVVLLVMDRQRSSLTAEPGNSQPPTPSATSPTDPSTSPRASRAASTNTPRRTTTTPTSSSDARARRQLATWADQGARRFTPDNRWVVQLASKWPGIKDPRATTRSGSHRFRAADIVEEHQELRDRFGDDVILLRSIRIGRQLNYPGKPADETLWVTLYDPGTFSDAAEARAWCQRAFPDTAGDELKNVCFVRQASPPHK